MKVIRSVAKCFIFAPLQINQYKSDLQTAQKEKQALQQELDNKGVETAYFINEFKLENDKILEENLKDVVEMRVDLKEKLQKVSAYNKVV